jgi:hypothetical protein
MELRLVPESELMDETSPSAPASKQAAKSPVATSAASSPPASSRGTPATPESEKGKRVASTLPRGPRANKKKKTAADEALISPTLLTWVVSAGVVVLISVVGFGAGYVIGREVGRQETLSSIGLNASDTSACGRNVIRSSGGGLRRFRWGTSMGRTIVASS